MSRTEEDYEDEFYEFADHLLSLNLSQNEIDYINQVIDLAEASGFFETELRRLLRVFRRYVPKLGNGIFSAPLRAVKAVNESLQRKDYPPSMREALSKYGNSKIVGLTVGRNPIISAIQKTANLLLGDKLKEVNIDTLLHLFLIIELDNGTSFKTERNQVLNFTQNIGEVKESMPVDLKGKSITLKEFFDTAFKRVGNMLFRYSAHDNNCQSYVIQLLGSNGLLTPELREFIKQDTKTLLSPFLQNVTNAVTDAAAAVDTVMSGRGRKLIRY